MALMAEAKAVMVMGFVAVVVLMGAADVAAQSTDCNTQIASLLPCLNFVGGSDKTPSTACCNAFAKVVSTNATCLCLVLTGNSGYQINQTKALTLPSACNVVTPPVSDCNAAPVPSSPAENPLSIPGSVPPPTAPVPSSPAESPLSIPGSVPPPSTGSNSNAGAVFAPSMVAIVSVVALVLMKILS